MIERHPFRALAHAKDYCHYCGAHRDRDEHLTYAELESSLQAMETKLAEYAIARDKEFWREYADATCRELQDAHTRAAAALSKAIHQNAELETKRNEAQQRYLDEMVVSGKRGARIDELETLLREAEQRAQQAEQQRWLLVSIREKIEELTLPSRFSVMDMPPGLAKDCFRHLLGEQADILKEIDKGLEGRVDTNSSTG